ncbi:MAG TPA: sigma 54-interacting transcriptional regulator [Terriglobales bacterium]|nr:sigma 54-interacting transcriptional regulator [Terriglobales bacterium]
MSTIVNASDPPWETLFESLPDAAVLADDRDRILRINIQVEQLFGFPRAELLNKPLDTLLPQIATRRKDAGVEGTLSAGNETIRMEITGRRKDGTEFPADTRVSRVETAQGKFVLYLIRDTSARRNAEGALRGHEEEFRLLVENVKDYAIFLLDPKGNVVNWNAGAERIKGYKASEIIGRHFSCFYPAGSADKKPAEELRIASDKGRFADEGWRIRKNGTQFWANVVITALRDQTGDLIGFTKITRDFTERKLAEQALQQREKKLNSFFEYSPNAIVVSDLEGRITQVNGQFEKFFGYDRGELLGQTIEVLVPERFRKTHPAHRADYKVHPRVRPMGAGLELFGRRKDGTEFPVDITLGPVETEEGRVVMSIIRDLSEIKQTENALRRAELENLYLQDELLPEHKFEDIIGESRGLKKVLKEVETVAATDVTVLILGETGTGKDLIARAIHQLSSRNKRTLVKLNCAAIPTGLLESELFGHEKGAFTGAIAQKIGRIELAHQGTLFLDEVGDLPLETQPKLLRALQEKEFERLGSTRTIPVDARLVAATNRDLSKMVASREFRSDLYYRLRVFPISLPPLRERREDIPLLVNYFVDKYARQLHRKIERIPSDVMHALVEWPWPGNIRELENFIERAVILSKGPDLRAPLAELAMAEDIAPRGEVRLDAAERDHILRVLRECKGMIGGPKGAASRLGVKRTTLNSKLKKLGIRRQDYI